MQTIRDHSVKYKATCFRRPPKKRPRWCDPREVCCQNAYLAGSALLRPGLLIWRSSGNSRQTIEGACASRSSSHGSHYRCAQFNCTTVSNAQDRWYGYLLSEKRQQLPRLESPTVPPTWDGFLPPKASKRIRHNPCAFVPHIPKRNGSTICPSCRNPVCPCRARIRTGWRTTTWSRT